MKNLTVILTLLVTRLAFGQSRYQTGVFQPEQKCLVFLIGDAGELGDHRILSGLRTQVNQAGRESIVIFLGDNVYPRGLPPTKDPARKTAESILKRQLGAVTDLTNTIGSKVVNRDGPTPYNRKGSPSSKEPLFCRKGAVRDRLR